MKVSIYAITNKLNGKRYIGVSETPEKRYRTHMQQLKRGTHANFYMQKDYYENGADIFEFNIIETKRVASIYKKRELERNHIKEKTNLYNIQFNSQNFKFFKERGVSTFTSLLASKNLTYADLKREFNIKATNVWEIGGVDNLVLFSKYFDMPYKIIYDVVYSERVRSSRNITSFNRKIDTIRYKNSK